jgi:hypothetical protein
MTEHRGRPTNVEAVKKEKWTLECSEYPSKPELGYQITYHYDSSKSKNGPFKTETTYPKGFIQPKVKIEKSKPYGNLSVVMVFKTSNRSNAKTKIKIWKNENIDYIMSAKSLPGVPDNAHVLELGVGNKLIEKYKLKYKL